jgi:tRNA (cmo5U34)-methyltransferase
MNKNLFSGAYANTYDTRIERLVPGYRLAHELTLAKLETLVPNEATILIAGAGTGTEVGLYASHRPRWRFIAVEPSQDMAAVLAAKADAGGFADRLEIVRGTLDSADPRHAADACVAHLVTHFLAGDEAKQAFFQAIAARLAPGASLLHLDYVPPAASLDPAYLAWARQIGQPESDVDMMEGRILKSWDAANRDRLAGLLRSAGFDDTRSFFQALDYRCFSSRLRR